jgi:hypothetical protein
MIKTKQSEQSENVENGFPALGEKLLDVTCLYDVAVSSPSRPICLH